MNGIGSAGQIADYENTVEMDAKLTVIQLSEDELSEIWGEPLTKSEILDQRGTVNLKEDEQRASTSEASDAEIAHTDQPEDSNKSSGSEPASINANNPEGSGTSKIENASTSNTTDAQEAYKSKRATAAEGLPGITYDFENDGYQTEAGGVKATFKNLEDAKAYQELLTGFKYDGEGQRDGLLNYMDPYSSLGKSISTVATSLSSAQGVVTGNAEKSKREVQEKLQIKDKDKTAREDLEEMCAKKKDTFWGCQAPDKVKLASAELMKEQQGPIANFLEQIGPESELGKLKSERDAIKSGPSLDEIKSQKEEIERTISECVNKINGLREFAKKHAILATIFGKIFSMISQSLLAKINTLSTKYANLNRAEIDLMELPNKEIQIRDKEERVFQGFAKSLIDLADKENCQIIRLEGVMESDRLCGTTGREFSAVLDGISTTISPLLKDADGITTATTLENFAKTYGEEYLLKAVKAACTIPGRNEVLQAFHKYWGNNHSQEEPCPYVLVLEKGLNDIALEYKDLLKREEPLTRELSKLQAERKELSSPEYSEKEEALTEELSKLQAEWEELSSSEYSDVAEVEEKIKELEQRIHERSISLDLQKISARKSELEKQFESDYKSKGKVEGDAYVLNIGSRTIMTQPDQAGVITLESISVFAEKVPESPVKQPTAAQPAV